MKNIIIAALTVICFTVAVSCNKNEANNSDINDIFTLNNEVDKDDKIIGFNFEPMQIIKYPNTDELAPDFIV